MFLKTYSSQIFFDLLNTQLTTRPCNKRTDNSLYSAAFTVKNKEKCMSLSSKKSRANQFYISDMKSEKVGGRKYYECPLCKISTYQMRRHLNKKHKTHPDLKVDLKKLP